MEKTWKMNVDCANCALMMEEAVRKVKGVEHVNINAMMQKITLQLAADAVIEDVMQQVKKACRKIEPDAEIDC